MLISYNLFYSIYNPVFDSFYGDVRNRGANPFRGEVRENGLNLSLKGDAAPFFKHSLPGGSRSYLMLSHLIFISGLPPEAAMTICVII